jgi:hypothetical protein
MDSMKSWEIVSGIAEGQTLKAKTMVMSKIEAQRGRGDVPVHSLPPPEGVVKELTIRESEYPDQWTWNGLNRMAIEGITISKCILVGTKLTPEFVDKISGSKVLSMTVTETAPEMKGAFEKLYWIRMLSLSKNGLTTESLQGLFTIRHPYLWSLDLSYNQIMAIDYQVLNQLPSLTHLRLEHNLLKQVNLIQDMEPAWSRLKEVWLMSNDWSCSTFCDVLTSRVKHMPNMLGSTTCWIIGENGEKRTLPVFHEDAAKSCFMS